MRRLILLGVILILVGLLMLALNIMGIGTRLFSPGTLFLGALGGACLAGYVYTKWYGFLIPGCILAFLWLSISLAGFLPSWPGDLEGAVIIGGLGASFFAIYVVDRFYAARRRTWPLWPGLGLIIFSIPVALAGIAPEGLIGAIFVAGPGIALLVIYLWRRAYAFLIPGCILIGVGLVIPVLEPLSEGTEQQGILAAGLIVGAVGLAFLAVYVLDKLYTKASNWWPLLPGFFLLVIGGLLSLTGAGIGLTLEHWQALGNTWTSWWPFGLILLGLWLVLRWALRGRRETREMAPRQDT